MAAPFSWSRYWSGEDMVEDAGGARCTISHPDAGGQCPNPAAGEVYGLPFCIHHGTQVHALAEAEAVDTARHEIASLFDASSLRGNRFATEFFDTALRDSEAQYGTFDEQLHAVTEEQPFIESRVDPLTQKYYGSDLPPAHLFNPVDAYHARCRTLHEFMRTAHEADDAPLVSVLEQQRESALAQLSFASFLVHASMSSERHEQT